MQQRKHQPNKKRTFTLRAVAFAITGVVCLFTPNLTLNILSIVAGAILIIIGIFTFITWLRAAQLLPANTIQLIAAIAEVAIGVTFFIKPESMAILVGIFMLSEGVSNIVRSINYRRAGSRGGVWMLAIGIGAAVIGVCAMIKPVAGAITISVIIGIGCLLISIGNLLAAVGVARVERYINEVKNKINRNNGFEEANVVE
ncbi:MAG: DUF308 domain-containing protein [Bacteroidales bacterium]|nr:DUF308 domain-containing protein [Bacteroidales bacterium]